MDIKIKSPSGNFKYRVAGVLIDKNNRILIQKIGENEFYCLPGGHVEIGETSMEAAKRELEEELRFNVSVTKPLFIIENIFKNSKNQIVHEVGMYYNLTSNNAPINDWNYLENDKGVLKTLHYKWVTQEELKNIDFRPNFLKNLLFNNISNFSHFVVKNNILTQN